MPYYYEYFHSLLKLNFNPNSDIMKGKKQINILVVGLLSTGSSALIDLLKEYENINVIPNEFDDFRAPGLVADQLKDVNGSEFQNKIKSIIHFKRKIRLIYNIFPIFKFNKQSLSGIRYQLKTNIFRFKELNLLEDLNKKLSAASSISSCK